MCTNSSHSSFIARPLVSFLFHRQAQAAAGEAIGLSDDDLAEVITEIKKLWPECRMVRGSPRYSQSNGGVERVNRTVQYKLGHWMNETNSVRWTIGCKLVQWRYNTQHHRTVGTTPYHLLVGQAPGVGISQLPLDTALLNTLATEAELNQLVDIESLNEQLNANEEGSVDEEAINEAEQDAQEPQPGEQEFEALFLGGPGLDGEVGDTDDAQPIEQGHENVGAAELVGIQGGAIDDAQPREQGHDDHVGAAENVGNEEGAIDAAPHPDQQRREVNDFGVVFGSAALAQGTTNNGKPDYYNSDSDEDLPLSALKERGEKTTGDTNDTVWQVLVSELDAKVDREYLQRTKLGEKAPIAYCTNVKDITAVTSFVPAILVRVSTKKWELMDENDDEMEQLEWDGDDGICNMLGMYIRHPDKEFCEYFQSMKRASEDTQMVDDSMTPRRKEMRKRAHEKMVKASESMKKRAREQSGGEKVCEVGEVVLVPLSDMDRLKVDPANLLGVIVQVDKTSSMARVAVKTGLLKNWYAYHRLGHVKGDGNNVELNGLSEVLNNWQTLKVTSEREANRKLSQVGGQGRGCVTCSCKGKCNTNHCSCKKAGRICTSACHRNNFCCENHDRH
jgi:hypothetical protein